MIALPPGTDVSKIPLGVNPSGAPPNFVDPPSLESTVLGTGVALILISSVLLCLRLFRNFKHTGRLGLDDVLCLIGELGGIGYWAIVYSFAREGVARHVWDIPVTVITHSFIKRQFAQMMIAGLMMWSAKAAILALYINIFESVRWLRITSYGLIIFTGLFYMSSVVVAAVDCLPHKGEAWDQTSFARCGSSVSVAVVNGVFGTVADMIIFALPFPVVLKLQLTLRKRIGLIIVFAAGFLTVITSVVSLAFRVVVFLGNAIACFAEVFGTVMVSCAPAMACFWNHIFTETCLYSKFGSNFLSRRSHDTSSKESQPQEYYGYGLDKDLQELASHNALVDDHGSNKSGYVVEINGMAAPADFITNATTETTPVDQRSAYSKRLV